MQIVLTCEEGGIEQTLKMMFENNANSTASTKKLNLFGGREYVSQYRGKNSYKWYPEDERLQFAWITVHTGKSAEYAWIGRSRRNHAHRRKHGVK